MRRALLSEVERRPMAKGDFKALTYLMLGDVKKAPGDPVSAAELAEAGQSSENIDQLIESGALGGTGDEIHQDHKDSLVSAGAPEETDNHVTDSEAGGGNE